MSNWGCPHEVDEKCLRLNEIQCNPGMKGCILYGRYLFSNPDKNKPRSAHGPALYNNREGTFNGFSTKTLDFLKDLRSNNNKIWFEANKQDYQKYLLEPLQNMVIDLGDFMLTIDTNLEIRPAVDKTISRIYRDTRFSGDKSPYKSTMWITFKRPRKDWKDAPAYYFEISPHSYRYGMGFYSASIKTMDRLRNMIDKRPDEFLEAISFYSRQKTLVVEGEKYKRILNNSIPEEVQDWYQRKNLYLVCNRNIDEYLFNRALIDDMISGFSLLAPFYYYLWRLK